MIDAEDKLLGAEQVKWLTQRRRTNADMVIVTEKVDGMNGRPTAARWASVSADEEGLRLPHKREPF
jgi:hypothetical protein